MKRKMKKQLAVISMAAFLMVGATACGSGEPNSNTDGTQTGTEENQQVEKETKEPKEPLEFKNQKACFLWENVEEMPYYDETVPAKNVAKITPYIAENKKTDGCVIICPGGGYSQVAASKEGGPVALALNEEGISAFVLNYRISPYDYQAMLSDVCRAVRYVRYYAEDFGIDPDKIAIMGFSAGGHLAAMNLEHAEEDTQDLDAIDRESAKANLGVLCYPVISLDGDYAHQGSREKFLGQDNMDDENLAKKYSADLGVTKDMVPCFVWHCKPDETVPYENSQMFADAMEEAGVDCELHLFETGWHGVVLAEDNEEVAQWFPMCMTWLQKNGF